MWGCHWCSEQKYKNKKFILLFLYFDERNVKNFGDAGNLL